MYEYQADRFTYCTASLNALCLLSTTVLLFDYSMVTESDADRVNTTFFKTSCIQVVNTTFMKPFYYEVKVLFTLWNFHDVCQKSVVFVHGSGLGIFGQFFRFQISLNIWHSF